MSRSLIAALFGAAVLATPLVVSAQDAAPASTEPAPAADTAPQANDQDGGRRICKSITATGSRLGKTRICKTAREWELQRQEERRSLDRAQRRGDKQSGG